MSFITTEFHEILLRGSRGIASLEEKQDWRTNWRVKNIIPPELVAWGKNIKNLFSILQNCLLSLRERPFISTNKMVCVKFDLKLAEWFCERFEKFTYRQIGGQGDKRRTTDD